MTALFLIGDVRDRMATLEDGTFDFILCSPPFLALRSYLPDGHPDKAKEIGSEATPAEFLDVLLELTAEWGRLLAPHGSIAIELGDTYAGSGGAGGDYDEDGLREGQPKFKMDWSRSGLLPKSLVCIPQLYQVGLAYGRNVLRAPLSARELLDVAEDMAETYPDLTVPTLLAMLRDWLDRYEETGPTLEYERWRVRNLKPWIRSNPPVGALGDKERPATSYVIVATRARDRWFDLDAVRVTPTRPREGTTKHKVRDDVTPGTKRGSDLGETELNNAAGAPPRDWWHHVDAILDAELAARAGKPSGWSPGPTRTGKETEGARGGNWSSFTGGTEEDRHLSIGAQGVHLRRALERAGILTTLDALDVSPKGYSGAHYAVWPPELVRLLVDEMCPRRVCVTCGLPSRRIVEAERYGTRPSGQTYVDDPAARREHAERYGYWASGKDGGRQSNANIATTYTTVGWSDCGHNTWRPGRILDPFVGSGTTLAVATGMGRDATGIDIDERNAWLALERVGMFITVDQPTRKDIA